MRAGEVFEIASGNRRAMITEQGASLHRVQWDGAELLYTSADDGYATSACYGQHLMPFPGRVPHGIYDYQGERFQLPIDEHDTIASIHGWARWATWVPAEHTPDAITMRCRLFALPGYPFPFDYELSYRWRPDSLEITAVAKNIGGRTAPFGYGSHAYFTLGQPTVNQGVLQVPASKYYELGPDLVPHSPPVPVDGTDFDFRAGRPIGEAELDITLTELARDENGRAHVMFRAADGSLGISFQYDEPLGYVQLYTGDTLPSHRREGLAIEPNTCPPNAFNSGTGLINIAPGASARVRWALSAS